MSVNEKHKNKKPYPNNYIGQFFELLKILPPDFEPSPLSVKSTDNLNNWQDAGHRRWSRYKTSLQQWANTTREEWTDAKYEEWVNAMRNQWIDEARWSLYQQLEELPIEFQDYIWGADAKPKYNPLIEYADEEFNIEKLWHPTLEAIIRYEDFSSLLFYLRVVNKFVNNKISVEKPILQTQMLPIIGQTRFQLNKHNKIEIYPDELSRALEGIDVTRLCQCGRRNCQRLFWAARIDQKCCSTKCHRVWKMEMLRDRLKNNRAAVNEERRENRKTRKIHKAKLEREKANK